MRYQDVTNPPKYTTNEAAITDFNGKTNTNTFASLYTGNFAASVSKSFKFPDNRTNGFVPAMGQLNTITIQNRTTFFNLNNLITSQLSINYNYWSSTNYGYLQDAGSVVIYCSYSSNQGVYVKLIEDTGANLLVTRDWND